MECFSIGHAFKCAILVCISVRTRTAYINPSHVYLTNRSIKTTRDLFSYSRDLWLLFDIIFFPFSSEASPALNGWVFGRCISLLVYSWGHYGWAHQNTSSLCCYASLIQGNMHKWKPFCCPTHGTNIYPPNWIFYELRTIAWNISIVFAWPTLSYNEQIYNLC